MSSFINVKNCGYTPHPDVHISESMVMNSNLTRESSTHAITFNESQNTMGGSGSMNMDEFLKNIWTSEETQTAALNSDLRVADNGSLPRTLSRKTVEEVWRELRKENGGFKDVNLINLQPQEKHPALTLEEFLRKAGRVSEIGQTKVNYLQKQVNDGGVNGVSIIGKSDNPTKSNLGPRSPSDLFPNGNLDTSPSPPRYAYGASVRNTSGSLEKVVERRRKRMIKNRESAARSRARKQAYTLELEAEVEKLKRINQELQKKQVEIMESHNFQVPEKMKLSGNGRPCLRRTLTGPW